MTFAARLTRSPIPYEDTRTAEVQARFAAQPPEILALLDGTAGCSPYLAGLMERRYPIYAEADFTVLTGDQPLDEVVDRLTELLQREGLIRDVA